jgi:hypothetical protein
MIENIFCFNQIFSFDRLIFLWCMDLPRTVHNSVCFNASSIQENDSSILFKGIYLHKAPNNTCYSLRLIINVAFVIFLSQFILQKTIEKKILLLIKVTQIVIWQILEWFFVLYYKIKLLSLSWHFINKYNISYLFLVIFLIFSQST